jgi:hypothetical protein
MLGKTREHREIEPHEMSAEQLVAAIADLESMKARRAKSASDEGDEEGVFE